MRDFNHTVNVLVKAFFDGTLQHGNCYACAVGNMVASAMGKVFRTTNELSPNTGYRRLHWEGCDYPAHGGGPGGWGQVFSTDEYEEKQEIDLRFYKDEAKKQIDSTGYSIEELARVEFAFETAEFSEDKNQRMFNGLMAVVEVLADIHNISLEAKETAKQLFVKV